MTHLTQDVRPGWLNVVRRLQSVAKSRGYSVVSLRVLVDAGGNPVGWAEPKVVRLEPAESLRLQTVLREKAKVDELWSLLTPFLGLDAV